ncbi:hypothetical protein [Streptomyces rimosus]|uniref:hypothetical protein n=1 Tax=Streptomyces rimosus TaxID=1927 RepID=UPI001F3265EE|nr:hypothetical protein [Streptomyces rimosus]
MAVITGDDRARAKVMERYACVATVTVEYGRGRFTADLRPADDVRKTIAVGLNGLHTPRNSKDHLGRHPNHSGSSALPLRVWMRVAASPTSQPPYC